MFKKFEKYIYILIALVIVAGLVDGYSRYISYQSCPVGYINIPYKDIKFCVAKYEMKKGPEARAVSHPKGLPWDNLTREEAISACKRNGDRYDLIDTIAWTDVARMIANVPENWSKGIIYEGHLNIGHASATPPRTLEASSDDDDSCYQLSEKCSLTQWKPMRRVHILPNQEIIWDFSGNVSEFMNDKFISKMRIESSYISMMNFKQPGFARFAPRANCTDPASKENLYCGYGWFWKANTLADPVIARGGHWDNKGDMAAGIFSAIVRLSDGEKYPKVGFRCVFEPMNRIKSIPELIEQLRDN